MAAPQTSPRETVGRNGNRVDNSILPFGLACGARSIQLH